MLPQFSSQGRVRLALFLFPAALLSAQPWTARIEEPTGIYRRDNEVVRLPLPASAPRTGFLVKGPEGQPAPWQRTNGAILFPASLIPGQLPVYTVTCCAPGEPRFPNEILIRRPSPNRLELGNSRFRIVVNLAAAAIVEAYNLSAGEHHRLNLVETTPEDPAALKDDIHTAADIPPPVPGVSGENLGWTTLAGSGPISNVEILESGPLRGRLRLTRSHETWEFLWTASSPALLWTAPSGFQFRSISASPYLPFDRCVSGDQYHWPLGPEQLEPPDHDVAPRAGWNRLPGGDILYYHHAADYGALGIVSLDDTLQWTGAGSRRFLARRPTPGPSTIALTFPPSAGWETALNGRAAAAVLRHPLRLLSPAPDLAQPSPPSPGAKGPLPPPLSLDGPWQLSAPGFAPITVPVPGDVHTQIYPADPFSTPLPKYFTHEADWISAKVWTLTRAFDVPPSFAGRRLRLQFDATDYYADAYLNGQYLGRHEGYIDPYEYDVTGIARPGASNKLEVRLWTPVSYYWRHRPYDVKGSYGAVDQKPDDITAEGITRHVRLVASGQAFIQDLAINTRLLDDNGSRAEVDVHIATAGSLDGCSWSLTLSPRNFTGAGAQAAIASAGEANPRFVLSVDHPQLWWTWDHGKPNLYTLDVQLHGPKGELLDSRSLAVGIREIAKDGWFFSLNRKRLFIRGTNYYAHLFLAQPDRAWYQRDLDLMRGMNVNMIRLHTHFTNPEFYDLADEMGILVWQDYLEAWYPHDTAFSLRAAALYDPLIRSVRNHPSIALWATSDEEDLENYRDLTKHLAARPALLDPQRRPVVRSTGRYGDAHVYHGWYDGSVWDYTRMTEPFVSELGATSLPNYSSLVKFLPDAWPIPDHAAEWEFRKLQIPEALRAWGPPGNLTLEQYVPRTQAYVSRLFQIALERSRRLKYNPSGGILHFHAIDLWPSVTMAAIDFYRQPTAVYDTVRRSFAPVLASLEYDRDTWKSGGEFRCAVWAVNDLWDPLPGSSVRWRILDPAGAVQASGVFPASLPADSSQRLGEVRWTASGRGARQLHAEVISASGATLSENIFDFQIQ